MKTALRDKLLSITELTDIIGSSGVYSFPAPQGAAMPYLMLSLITSVRSSSGCAVKQSSYNEEWQIDIYADTDVEAEEIRAVIEDNMISVGEADWGSASNGYIRIHSSILISVTDNSSLEDDDGQNRIVRKTIELHIIREKRT